MMAQHLHLNGNFWAQVRPKILVGLTPFPEKLSQLIYPSSSFCPPFLLNIPLQSCYWVIDFQTKILLSVIRTETLSVWGRGWIISGSAIDIFGWLVLFERMLMHKNKTFALSPGMTEKYWRNSTRTIAPRTKLQYLSGWRVYHLYLNQKPTSTDWRSLSIKDMSLFIRNHCPYL